MPALTNRKHEQFCQLVAGGMSGVKAYTEVGFVPSSRNAGRLISQASIKARIAELMERGAARTEVTVERTVRELAMMAFYDPADLTQAENEDGDMVPITGPAQIRLLPERVRRAIVGWSYDRSGNFTLKLANKDGAIEKLGRYLGMFRDKVEHSGANGGPIPIEHASKVTVEEVLAALPKVEDEC